MQALFDAIERGDTQGVRQNVRQKGVIIDAELMCVRLGMKITALHCACSKGNVGIVCIIIAAGANIDVQCGEEQMTPLHMAAQFGHEAVARTLCNRGAQVDKAMNFSYGFRLIWEWDTARSKGREEMKKFQGDHGAQLDKMLSKDGCTPLYIAAENGHEATVGLLCAYGAQLDEATFFRGHTPLFAAAKFGHEATAKLLCDRGAKLDKADLENRTPLFAAAQNGHEATARLLCDRGAQLDKAYSTTSTVRLFTASHKALCELVADGALGELVAELLRDRGAQPGNTGATPLFVAAQQGHEATARLLCDRGAQLDKARDDGATPLHFAAGNGHEATARLLCDRGAQLDKARDGGITPLIVVAGNGHEATTRLLCDRGAQVDKASNHGYTPLHLAAQNGHEATARLLCDRGTQVDKACNNGYTPLHFAARRGHEATTKLLCDRGAQLDKANDIGCTPLCLVARNGHEATTRLLCDRGAQVNKASNDGYTPLQLAAGNGQEETTKLLCDRGAQLDKATHRCCTPLYIAALTGHEATAKLLCDRGAQLDKAEDTGRTPLFVAARDGREATARLLCDCGAQLDKAEDIGRTPLFIAAQEGHNATVRLLCDLGAQLDAAANDGQTPLIIAAYKGNTLIVELLVQHGANLGITFKGNSAEAWARSQGHVALAKYLGDARDLTTLLHRACECPPDEAPRRVRAVLRGEAVANLEACTRSGRTALELVTVPEAWAHRSLVNPEVEQLLRAAMAMEGTAAIELEDFVTSFAEAPASFRRYVMPELLMILSKDLRDAVEPERRRPGLPGYPSSDIVPRILSFLERDAFEWGAREVHFCGHCGVSDARATLTRCTGCKRVWYCSVKHQRRAWKTHKLVCDGAKRKRGAVAAGNETT